MKTNELITEAVVKVKTKTKTYVRVNASAIAKAFIKAFKVDVPPYGYGDELHVFENVKPVTSYKKQSITALLADEELSIETFLSFENSRQTDSGDYEFMIGCLKTIGAIDGDNFIIDMKD